MTEQIRYDGRLEDGALVLAGEHERLEVGPLEAVVDLIGETYTIEYGPRERAVSWVRTDPDGTITVDVRDAVTDWAYTETFVANVRDCPPWETDDRGYPLRAAVFAELVTTIWDEKGHLES